MSFCEHSKSHCSVNRNDVVSMPRVPTMRIDALHVYIILGFCVRPSHVHQLKTVIISNYCNYSTASLIALLSVPFTRVLPSTLHTHIRHIPPPRLLHQRRRFVACVETSMKDYCTSQPLAVPSLSSEKLPFHTSISYTLHTCN